MSGSIPAIELSAPTAPIPTCSPNLMPFHISYSGLAPMSTYFRPKAAPKPDFGADSPATVEPTTNPVVSDSQSTLVDEAAPEEDTSQLSLASTSTIALIPDVDMKLEDKESSSSGHLIAAFRGRTMRGMTVDLPAGYAGVVISTPEATHTGNLKEPAGSKIQKPPSSKRSTRGSKQMIDNDDEPDLTELADALEASRPARTLEASATFSSLVIWNADIPLDAGRDEYLRSLSEWTTLAAMVHSHEDD